MTAAPFHGKPLKFPDPSELSQRIDEYFRLQDPHMAKHQVPKVGVDGKIFYVLEEYITHQEPYTVADLAYHLGTNRQTLLNYEDLDYHKDMDPAIKLEYLDAISGAKDRIEAFTEKRLYSGHSAGAKFILSNNFGTAPGVWADRKEVTGKDGEPLATPLAPAELEALHNALETVANGHPNGVQESPDPVPGSEESSGILEAVPEPHPEAAA